MMVRVMTLDVHTAMRAAGDASDPLRGVTQMYAEAGDGDVCQPFESRGPYLGDCGCAECGGWRGA